MRSVADRISRWPSVIADNQDHLRTEGIADTAIQNFDTPGLLKLIDGYGHEGISNAVANLDAWHDRHYWKSKASNWAPTEPEEQEITT
jgi:hypothetical protein